MKKLLGIVVLGLLLISNIAYSQIVILRCDGQNMKQMKNGELKKKPINFYSIFKLDLDNNYYTRDGDDLKSYFINTEDKILWYELGPTIGGFMISFHHLSRITGEKRYQVMYIDVNDYKTIKIKFDQINKTIPNYKPNLDYGDQSYGPSENSPKDKELMKYKLAEDELKALKYKNDFTEGYWQCKQQQKAF